MARITENTNICAFLDMLAWSEIGTAILSNSDDGYNVLVGSTPSNILTFDDYSTHPNILNAKTNSTAAGRYQLLHRYFEPYATLLGLPDFSPESQDKIAVQQIKERKAYPLVIVGQLEQAIERCSNIWASLPGNSYGQHANSLDDLQNAYENAGGEVAS